MKDDVQEDPASLKKFGLIDVYVNISPGALNGSIHVWSRMIAVKKFGPVSLIGVLSKDIQMPRVVAVLNNLTIQEQYMHEREDFRGLIKFVELGVWKLGKVAGHNIAAEFLKFQPRIPMQEKLLSLIHRSLFEFVY